MEHNERFEELATLQALGIPLGAETEEFARHLDECPVCQSLLAELRAASTALAISAPAIAPRPHVRDRILSSIDGSSSTVGSPMTLATPGRTFAPWLMALAAAILLVVFVWDDARLRRQREELRSQSADLSSRLESAQRNLARRDLQARVLESDDVRLLFLGGKAPQPGAHARVFWSPTAKRAFLVAGNLSPLPPDKQYELWVFSKGKPVRAGVFDADPSGRALVESTDLSSVEQAENFAVTVEPRGGVPAPTGPIVLVGAP